MSDEGCAVQRRSSSIRSSWWQPVKRSVMRSSRSAGGLRTTSSRSDHLASTSLRSLRSQISSMHEQEQRQAGEPGPLPPFSLRLGLNGRVSLRPPGTADAHRPPWQWPLGPAGGQLLGRAQTKSGAGLMAVAAAAVAALPVLPAPLDASPAAGKARRRYPIPWRPRPPLILLARPLERQFRSL